MSSWLVLHLVLAASAPSDGATRSDTPVTQAQRPTLRIELLASPRFSMEEGTRTLASLRQFVFLYDDVLTSKLAFDETGWKRRSLGITGRLVKLVLLDVPIDRFLQTVEHEVFGHGARAREEGQWPEFSFGLPIPYSTLLSPAQQYSGMAFYEYSGLVDRDLPVTAGGIESNVFDAHFRAVRLLSDGGQMHYSDALQYFSARFVYVNRLLNTDVLGTHQNFGDPDEYARGLMQRFDLFGREAQITTSQRLRRAWATTFVDPMWWWSATQLIVDYLGRGERWSTVPRLHLGDAAISPLVRFNLSPFGAEHYLDIVITVPQLTVDAYVRAVSSGLALSIGTGARVLGWKPRPWLEVGGALDVWLQPELLPDYLNAFDGRQLPGISLMAEATWRPLKHWGLVGQLGWKSSGYVMSLPARAGIFGFGGVALLLDR